MLEYVIIFISGAIIIFLVCIIVKNFRDKDELNFRYKTLLTKTSKLEKLTMEYQEKYENMETTHYKVAIENEQRKKYFDEWCKEEKLRCERLKENHEI